MAPRPLRLRRLADNAVWYFVSVGVVVVFLVPILGTIVTSLKPTRDINVMPPQWIFQPVITHYNSVLTESGFNFKTFFMNSIFVALGASVLVVLVNIPAAYSMVRYGTGGRRLFAFVVSLRLLPPIVFIVPMFILFQILGMLDSIQGLILVNTLLNTPLALLLFVGFVQDLPREVEESAMIDGASTWQVLRKIVLPLLLPGLSVVLVMTFLWTWNEFLFSLILTLNRATTVTVGASFFVTAWGVRWGEISAAIVMSLLPTLVFTFFVQRYLVSGLTLGAIKE
jgi:multiple sugar transport system permease protein